SGIEIAERTASFLPSKPQGRSRPTSGIEAMVFANANLAYHPPMCHADDFIAALKAEVQQGNATKDTELHLKREFQLRGWRTEPGLLAQAVSDEIVRLERQVTALRRLRAAVFGVA